MSDDDAFLSRWSRRKAQARQGEPLPEPRPEPLLKPLAPASAAAESVVPPSPAFENAQAVPPPPTLDEVERLPADASDFSRFVARGVQPEVKNAALKKLFSDPHFNVMDGLDIYIDDYSKPDPLPAAMLKQMVQGRFLGLFDDEPPQPPAASSTAPEAAPASSGPLADISTAPHSLEPVIHEDADLRLQQDLAAGFDGAAAGAEPGPRRQR
ncbi:DUF3306 domain-containing protein [Roseateles violae]|uniref:DUF3306 domain-containing protein n=1 Tax=Roseateles violae TaxID=3058042 RepID=A0ABT8DSK5_9BURK|nr:DUF3306 domain-containing protein [Pelomonas sp. PFR6]MDN3919894.1 DUF3306 domain-containing protein [Pelomonas sp. PFR6]